MSVIFPTQLNRMLRRLGQGDAAAATFAKDAFVRNLILLRFPAKLLGCNLLQLRLDVHGSSVRRARHRMCRLTAA